MPIKLIPAGTGYARLTEAVTTEYGQLIDLVRQAVRDKLRLSANGDYYVDVRGIWPDRVVVAFKGRLYSYAYTVAAPGLQSVYRFFNTATSSHFYTISADERDYVIQHYPQYRYEGNAWYALAAGDGSTLPLFRFYNTRRGTHFYTVSAPERDFVIQNYPLYQNEGVAYYVWSGN